MQRLLKRAAMRTARAAGLERHQIAAGRMFCERHALATVKRHRPRSGGRILCYHSVGQKEFGGINDVTPAQFRSHIELALAAGYRFVPASHIAATGGDDKDLAITFDDAATSVADHAQPILAEYAIPWTVFAVSGWSDHTIPWMQKHVLSWHGLAKLLEAGVEVGSHSVSHPDFGQIGATQVIDELQTSRRAFERHLGYAPEVFAIPFGQSMNWTSAAHSAAQDAGYTTIYAQAEETRAAGTIPRTFVTKFDDRRIFKALLGGAFDRWEEWV